MMLSSVLLPQPEGPTTQMNSLSWMSRLTPLRATISPFLVLNTLRTLSMRTLTVSDAVRFLSSPATT